METSNNSLLVLNDDCLDHIFQYFSQAELMRLLQSVHTRIDDAIERRLHHYPHLEFSMRFPPPYDAYQMQILGKHLKSLNVNVGYSTRAEEVLVLLLQLFQGVAETGRLRALKIQHSYITSDYVKLILPVAPILNELDLSRCDIEDDSQLALLLTSTTNLEILTLSSKDAANLDQSILRQLRCLKVNWIVGTTMFDVAEVSEQHPHLRILVYQSDKVDMYGPPIVGKIGHFH